MTEALLSVSLVFEVSGWAICWQMWRAFSGPPASSAALSCFPRFCSRVSETSEPMRSTVSSCSVVRLAAVSPDRQPVLMRRQMEGRAMRRAESGTFITVRNQNYLPVWVAQMAQQDWAGAWVLFQGILERNRARPHQPVEPARVRPAPRKAGRMANSGLIKMARREPIKAKTPMTS